MTPNKPVFYEVLCNPQNRSWGFVQIKQFLEQEQHFSECKGHLNLSKCQNVLFSPSDRSGTLKHEENWAELCQILLLSKPAVWWQWDCPRLGIFSTVLLFFLFAKLALFQNPGRLAQRCLKLSSMKTLLCTDLTGKNTALFRRENSRLLQACLISYALLSSLFPRKCADTRNSLSDHKQQPKGSKQEDLTLSKTS